MKKVASIMLCVVMVFTMSVSSLADGNSMTEVCTIELDDGISLEIVMYKSSQLNTSSTGDDNESNVDSIVTKQYNDGELSQKVELQPGSGKLFITNYENGIISGYEVKETNEIITYNGCQSSQVENPLYANLANETYEGRITYNSAYNYEVWAQRQEIVNVYSELIRSDIESYTINANVGTTLSEMSAVVTEFLISKAIANPETAAGALISNVAIWFAQFIVGGVVTAFFSEEVGVYVDYYNMIGVHTYSNRSESMPGNVKEVATEASGYHSDIFIEGFTPYNWNENDGFATAMWNFIVLSMNTYPGVASYS